LRYIYSLILFFSIVSCEGIINLEVIGDGNFVSQNRVNLDYFTELEFYEAFDLDICYSDEQYVAVKGDSNLLKYVTTEVVDGRLTVESLSNYDIFPRQPIRIVVGTNDINTIDIYGSGDVYIDSLYLNKLVLNVFSRAKVKITNLEVDQLLLFSNGGGNIFFDGNAEKLNLSQFGSGNASIQGYANYAQIIQEGSGIIDAKLFSTNNIDVLLFGSGLIYFSSDNDSFVSIEGIGRVYYSGSEPDSISVEGEGGLYKN